MKALAVALTLILASIEQTPLDLVRIAKDALIRAEIVLVALPSGGDIQARINQGSGVIYLDPEGTYPGPITVTSSNITVMSAAPIDGNVSPSTHLAKITGGIRIPIGTTGVRLAGLNITTTTTTDVVVVEGAQVIIDQCYIHGLPGREQRRGVALNGRDATITRSWISDIKGNDSQAIAGWNGPGPYVITDNYLESSGENIIFGGGDPTTTGLIPSDILIAHNTLSKPLAWRGVWQVKNLLELKNARRVTIDSNVMENVWGDAQTGFAIQLTVRNQDGGCPWCNIEDVLFVNNTIRHMSAAINILAQDKPKVSGRMSMVTFRGNRFEDINPTAWGGDARTIMVGEGPIGLQFINNTFSASGNSAFLVFYGDHASGLNVSGNDFPEGSYGIFGNDAPGLGKVVLDLYAPGYVWDADVVRRTQQTNIIYPTGTTIQ